jgi:hypothetical protein
LSKTIATKQEASNGYSTARTETSLSEFFKATIAGGMLFLLPLVLVVLYLPGERVRPLTITMMEAMSIVKRVGIGSSKALRATDLALPKSA